MDALSSFDWPMPVMNAFSFLSSTVEIFDETRLDAAKPYFGDMLLDLPCGETLLEYFGESWFEVYMFQIYSDSLTSRLGRPE